MALASILFALSGCEELEGDGDGNGNGTDSAAQHYSLTYEINFAKDVLRYADVAITFKNPLTLEMMRDTLCSADDLTSSICEVRPFTYSDVNFIKCTTSFSGIEDVVYYEIGCQYLLNEEKAAAISSTETLQYGRPGLNISCYSESGDQFNGSGSISVQTATISNIKLIFANSPGRFSSNQSGQYPEAGASPTLKNVIWY